MMSEPGARTSSHEPSAAAPDLACDFERPLARGAREWPRRPALLWDGGALDYGALESETCELAGRLAGLGLRAGSRLALLPANEPRSALLVHAALALGAPLVLLNARLTAHELAPLLADARPELLVCADALEPLAAQAVRGSALRCLPLRELFASPRARCAPLAQLDPQADHAILFTSGTSGWPKGVQLSIGAQWASARAAALHLRVREGERWLGCMPLYHVGGLAALLRAALAGGSLLLQPRFDAAAVRSALAHAQVSQLSLVPTMLARLLEPGAPPLHAPALRCALIGGAALAPELAQRARAAGWPLAPTYGLTEAASQLATRRPDAAPGAELEPLPGVALRIAGEDGSALPAATPGQILARGPQLMRGYLDRPHESARALAGGWLHTGDFGCLDARGWLRVLERRSDLIVSGGENVYPSEVEALLLQHPAVREAAVVGCSDPEWGQRVEAVLVCARGTPRTRLRAELAALCTERLAGFKRPRALHFARELPRTASGKLQRAPLRSALQARTGRAAAARPARPSPGEASEHPPDAAAQDTRG